VGCGVVGWSAFVWSKAVSVAVCVTVDEVALDVVAGDDAGAVAELVPLVGVVLVVALPVLVGLEDDGLGEVGVLVELLGDVLVDEDVPVGGGGNAGGGTLGGAPLGGGVDEACSGSHFETVGVGFTVPETVLPGEPELSARGAPTAATEARLRGAIAALTTNAPVVESKIPPAMRPIDTGRTRAKHM